MHRNLLHILLIVTLLLTSTGISMSMHYCGSSLIEVSLFSTPEPCCGSADCCHNENIAIDSVDDFSMLAFQFNFEPQEFQLELQTESATELVEDEDHSLHIDLPPPPKIQLFLASYQVYLL